jgi:hypothetical protein
MENLATRRLGKKKFLQTEKLTTRSHVELVGYDITEINVQFLLCYGVGYGTSHKLHFYYAGKYKAKFNFDKIRKVKAAALL